MVFPVGGNVVEPLVARSRGSDAGHLRLPASSDSPTPTWPTLRRAFPSVSTYFVGGRVNHFPSYGTSVTGLVRRYLSDDGQYISVFGSTGSVPELIREPGDFDVISSRSVGADAMFILGSRLVLRLNGSLGDEEWPGGRTAKFTTGSVGLGVRF